MDETEVQVVKDLSISYKKGNLYTKNVRETLSTTEVVHHEINADSAPLQSSSITQGDATHQILDSVQIFEYSWHYVHQR